MKRTILRTGILALSALSIVALSGCLSSGAANFASYSAFGVSQGSGSAQLSWTANPGEQDGFRVEASSDGTNFTVVQQLGSSTTSTTVTGLAAGKIYYFRVRGYNAAGTSPYSAVVTASIPAAS